MVLVAVAQSPCQVAASGDLATALSAHEAAAREARSRLGTSTTGQSVAALNKLGLQGRAKRLRAGERSRGALAHPDAALSRDLAHALEGVRSDVEGVFDPWASAANEAGMRFSPSSASCGKPCAAPSPRKRDDEVQEDPIKQDIKRACWQAPRTKQFDSVETRLDELQTLVQHISEQALSQLEHIAAQVASQSERTTEQMLDNFQLLADRVEHFAAQVHSEREEVAPRRADALRALVQSLSEQVGMIEQRITSLSDGEQPQV